MHLHISIKILTYMSNHRSNQSKASSYIFNSGKSTPKFLFAILEFVVLFLRTSQKKNICALAYLHQNHNLHVKPPKQSIKARRLSLIFLTEDMSSLAYFLPPWHLLFFFEGSKIFKILLTICLLLLTSFRLGICCSFLSEDIPHESKII